MIDKKTFKQTFAKAIETTPCIKRGQSWYIDGKDTLVVINLQKSDWNEQYFINLGIWLKALGEPSFPQYYRCHLYYRLESIFSQERELILNACSLEQGNAQLLEELAQFLTGQVLPFLRDCGSERTLRNRMAEGKLGNGLVLYSAGDYLFPNGAGK